MNISQWERENPDIVKNMNSFLDNMQKAVDKKDKEEIIKLFEFENNNGSYYWALTIEPSKRWDKLYNEANKILET